MYTPPPFRESDSEVLLEFIRDHGFATLVSLGPDAATLASHLPLEIIPRRPEPALFGHLAAGNPQAAALDGDCPVLAVFLGPHAYISPRWYRTPDVPTWDYAAVHVRATASRIRDRATLEEHLTRQVRRHEAATGGTAFDLASVNPEQLRQDLEGVIGFELTPVSFEASFKLSQNKPEDVQQTVITELERRGDANALSLAHLMRTRRA